MSTLHPSPDDHHEPAQYEIRLQGYLDARWADQFENLSFTHASDGTTILAGLVVDQAALYGLLRKVRDLGLPLLSVMQVDPKSANGSDIQPRHGSSSIEKETTHERQSPDHGPSRE
jgi:hypothetical protein